MEKDSPRLWRGLPITNHILRYGRLREVNVEFEQLPVNPRCPPQEIGLTHVSDEIPHCWIDGGTTESLSVALPSPKIPEALSVPADDGLGLNHEESLGPVPPDS